jgi:Double zinc ribbon
MMCSFCGTVNHPENRFCGMCGVRFERRKTERRSLESGRQVCVSCGHANESGHKFCGLCGSRVDRREQERRVVASVANIRATAVANAQLPAPEGTGISPASLSRSAALRSTVQTASGIAPVRPRPAPAPRSEPAVNATIGGPSFLGLSSEPQSSPEYLLEDESSSRGGLRKLVLLIILAVVAGLAYMQWRSTHNGAKSPTAPQAEPASVPDPHGSNKVPPAELPKPQKTPPQEAKAESPSPDDNVKKAAEKEIKIASVDAPAEVLAGHGPKASVAENPPPEEAIRDTTRQRPSAALVRAQRYLQGRGAPQNCEQGLIYLRAATQQQDPNAAIQMGALYASGHCVQRDPVKAYQWFNVARQQQPENRWVENNLNQLWAQMTPQERQSVQ